MAAQIWVARAWAVPNASSVIDELPSETKNFRFVAGFTPSDHPGQIPLGVSVSWNPTHSVSKRYLVGFEIAESSFASSSTRLWLTHLRWTNALRLSETFQVEVGTGLRLESLGFALKSAYGLSLSLRLMDRFEPTLFKLVDRWLLGTDIIAGDKASAVLLAGFGLAF